ncbi:toxin Cry1Ac domain D-VI-related protein, partial [Listeria booriae]|uniref:toxin Cry1Ac domain D-VI-related protein n=1 Tax=Listeria booriae TaxID=1552123 RepID=UPI00288097CC
MTSKKTLAKKAVKTMAVAAVAFSVVAQPLSMTVSADEVTPKAERQLLGATQNLVPIALPSFTTSSTTTGFEAWSIMQAERKPYTTTIQNLKPEVSAIGATDANGAFTINDTFGTTMKATADNLGFQIIQTKKNVMNYVGVQQAVKTIPGQKYVLEATTDPTGSTGHNEAGAYLSAIDGTSNVILGEAGSYLDGKYTYSLTFTATSTSTNLELLGFDHITYSNIKLSQYTNLTVGDITTSSTNVTVGTGTANTLVTMIIGGKTYTGTTDASGNVTININRPDPGQAISIKTSTDAIEKTVIDKTAEAGKTAVDALFLNNDQTQGIKNTTTQASIDAAQLEVNRVTNATTKADLQKELDKAQAQLDAKAFNEAATAATNALFVNNDPSKDIKDTTKQADIDAAQAEVNKVTDPTIKADLQKEIDKAQTQLDAKTAETAAEVAATTATDALFVNNDPSKDIKDTTKQADIDAAQAAVNKVTDPTVKADLQKEIDKAQTQLDAKAAEAA